jgi:hypothetical protein
MNDKTKVVLDDFESTDFVTREIEHNGKTKTYRFKELSEEEAGMIFDIYDKKGERDPVKVRQLRSRVIAAVVYDVDGGPLGIERAKAIKNTLANKLQTACLEVNGYGADAEKEAGEG